MIPSSVMISRHTRWNKSCTRYCWLHQGRLLMSRMLSAMRIWVVTSLSMTMRHLETLRQQANAWYDETTQQTINATLESITYLPALIKNKARDRNKRSREALTPEDKALRDTIALQEQAQHLLVPLF